MRRGTHVAYVFRVPHTNLPITGPPLPEWQKNSGQDFHSLQSDPLFVDPRAGDFRLRPGSPAVGAGEDGANIGACGVRRLTIHGRTRLRLGEGRTLTLEARLARPAEDGIRFLWELPEGKAIRGPKFGHTPPDGIDRFEVKLTALGPKGAIDSVTETVSVPPAELCGDGPSITVEGEAIAAHGGGAHIKFYEPVNASGNRAFHYWIRPVGAWLEWDLDIPEDGRYLIVARYTTNFPNARRKLLLEGRSPGPAYESIDFPRTGGWATSTDDWALKKLGPPLELEAGKHRLRMINLGDGVNIDCFAVVRQD